MSLNKESKLNNTLSFMEQKKFRKNFKNIYLPMNNFF